MKRILVLAISALFVFGLAATAFAIHAEIPAETQAVVAKGQTQITVGGSIRVRGEARDNTDFNDDVNDHLNVYDERIRLSVGADVAENLTGFVQLEVSDDEDTDIYRWGEFANGASGIYPKGNAKRGFVNLLQGWIQWNPGPAGLKIGHMPLALGNNLFFDHTKFGDDAIVVFANPAEGVHLSALTIKFEENNDRSADDADAYVLLGSYTTDMLSVGGDITWVHDKNFGAYDDGANLYNIGVRGSVNLEPVTFKANVEVQTGSAENLTGAPLPGCSALENDCDFAGLAALVSADVKAGGNKFGVEFGYGSGDDNPNDADFDTFVTSLSPGIPYYAFVYGVRVPGASGATGAGVADTMYIKAAADLALTEALGLKGSVIYLLAAEDTNLRGGTADDYAGTEIDATATYKLARNLNYWVEGGYLLAGDIYEDAAGDADDAWAVRHGIELSF